MKNARSKIKSIKTGKEIGTTYCLGVKVTLIVLNHKK